MPMSCLENRFDFVLPLVAVVVLVTVSHTQAAPRRLGGRCEYADYAGTATILKIEKTEASKKQAEVVGGAGYEGYEVWFSFETKEKIKHELARHAVKKRHEFRLCNSWYVGPEYIEKYGIKKDKKFECTLKVITKGTCSPVVFKFDKLDDTDYFESKKR